MLWTSQDRVRSVGGKTNRPLPSSAAITRERTIRIDGPAAKHIDNVRLLLTLGTVYQPQDLFRQKVNTRRCSGKQMPYGVVNSCATHMPCNSHHKKEEELYRAWALYELMQHQDKKQMQTMHKQQVWTSY